jgi:hypothetical protein
MKRHVGVLAALGLSILMGNAATAETAHWPEGAKVFFVEPKNGAEISGPVKVVMGVQGIEIAPAGTEKPNTGHHHILIDTDAPTGEKALAPCPSARLGENHHHREVARLARQKRRAFIPTTHGTVAQRRRPFLA